MDTPNLPANQNASGVAPGRGQEDPRLRLAMVVSYDGSPYQGWQIQDHGPTVQGTLEAALHTALRQRTRVFGSGRTDTGVHAFNQVAHFHAPSGTDLRKLRASLNGLCGPSISVKAVRPVPAEFHARHSAIGKIYRYHLFNRQFQPVFGRERCWWVRSPLAIDHMREAARFFLGSHDFSAFRAKECAAASPVRTIHRLTVETTRDEEPFLIMEIEASGFLQHMARIITGTLVAVGMGKMEANSIPGILESRNREKASATAPGKGLHLVRVLYDFELFPEISELERAANLSARE